MSLGSMFSLHIYLPSQLPLLCNVGIVVTCIYCSVLVIFNYLFGARIILVVEFSIKCLKFMWKSISFNPFDPLGCLQSYHHVICNWEITFATLWLLFLVFLLYYVSVKKNLTLNSHILVVFLSLKHFKVLFVCNAMVMNDHFKVLFFAMQSLFPSNLVPSATIFFIHTFVMVMHSDATKNPKIHIALNTITCNSQMHN
jgi:hypothetical protein